MPNRLELIDENNIDIRLEASLVGSATTEKSQFCVIL